MYFLLNDFTRQSAEFSGKNDLGACTQGVFGDKVRKRAAQNQSKVFYMFLSQ